MVQQCCRAHRGQRRGGGAVPAAEQRVQAAGVAEAAEGILGRRAVPPDNVICAAAAAVRRPEGLRVVAKR